MANWAAKLVSVTSVVGVPPPVGTLSTPVDVLT
jgi:hypothetical protein